jgi:hypothetical protein
MTSARPKIDVMSSEVVDSNPYSRLMALKRMGVVENYEVNQTSGFFGMVDGLLLRFKKMNEK